MTKWHVHCNGDAGEVTLTVTANTANMACMVAAYSYAFQLEKPFRRVVSIRPAE